MPRRQKAEKGPCAFAPLLRLSFDARLGFVGKSARPCFCDRSATAPASPAAGGAICLRLRVLGRYSKRRGELDRPEGPPKVKRGPPLARRPLIGSSAFRRVKRVEARVGLCRCVVKSAARREICVTKAADVKEGRNRRKTRALPVAFAACLRGARCPASAGRKAAARSTGSFRAARPRETAKSGARPSSAAEVRFGKKLLPWRFPRRKWFGSCRSWRGGTTAPRTAASWSSFPTVAR